MTDEELKEMAAETLRSVRELRKSQRETARVVRELSEETTRHQQETGRQLRESRRETDRQLQESRRETDRQLRESRRETDRRMQETDRQLRELGQQIGGLSNKFGGFTEGMAFPSMVRLLEDDFHMDNVAPRYRVHKNGRTLEIDVFAFTNTERNEAVVVEVKSYLDEAGLKQILRILDDVPRFMPQHRNKKIYAILACVDTKEEVKAQVLDAGIYLAQISDETFQLKVPEDFKPRCFQQNAPESAGSA